MAATVSRDWHDFIWRKRPHLWRACSRADLAEYVFRVPLLEHRRFAHLKAPVRVGTGFAALLVGVMLYPDSSATLSEIGTTWLGLAVASGYAYFGLNPTRT